MKNTSALFVGGPIDGQRRHMPVKCSRAAAPVKDGTPPRGWGRVFYNEQRFEPPTSDRIFVLEGMSEAAAIEQLAALIKQGSCPHIDGAGRCVICHLHEVCHRTNPTHASHD